MLFFVSSFMNGLSFSNKHLPSIHVNAVHRVAALRLVPGRKLGPKGIFSTPVIDDSHKFDWKRKTCSSGERMISTGYVLLPEDIPNSLTNVSSTVGEIKH